MDEKRLSEIEARLEDAARFERCEIDGAGDVGCFAGEDVNGRPVWDDLLTIGSDASDGDQEFVLAAWKDLLDAVAEVRRLREALGYYAALESDESQVAREALMGTGGYCGLCGAPSENVWCIPCLEKPSLTDAPPPEPPKRVVG